MNEKPESRWAIPDSWMWTNVSEIGDVVAGGTPSTKEPSYWADEINWISPADLTGYLSKTIKRGTKSISRVGLAKSSAKVMPAGSIHFSSRAPIGYVVISAEPLATNQGFKSLVPASGIFNEYIYYYLLLSREYAREHASGTTFLELSGKAFGRLSIPLAPLNEQRRIVAKIEELFSEIDKGVESLEKAREQLKIYRQAVLKHAFEGKLTARWRQENQDKSGLENAEWQFVKLHEIAEINPRLDKSVYADDLTVSFVPMPAVEAGTGVMDVSQIRPLHEVKKGYTHFQESDVLFAKITPCMENGKMAVVPPLRNKLGFGSTEFHVLRTSNQASEQYIFYFVSSEKFRRNAEHNMTGAVGQRRVPATWLANEHVPLPPLPEQRIIVARIEKSLSQITRLLKETDAQLIKTKSLRQSILKQAFSGQLVAQDPNDEPASVLLERIKAK